MSRSAWLGTVLSVMALLLAACSSSGTATSSSGGSSPADGGAVVGVAIPSSVSVVTANNAN